MQDLDPRVYSAIIQSAALLSRTRGSQAASHGPAGGGAGFHSNAGFNTSLFYTALEWPQSWDPCSQDIHSAVRYGVQVTPQCTQYWAGYTPSHLLTGFSSAAGLQTTLHCCLSMCEGLQAWCCHAHLGMSQRQKVGMWPLRWLA